MEGSKYTQHNHTGNITLIRVNSDGVFEVSHSCIIREVLDGNISFRFLLVSFTKWTPKYSSFG